MLHIISTREGIIKLVKKILYLNNFEAPYRVPFYNGLAEKYDLTLALTNKILDDKTRDKAWDYSGDRKYAIKKLKTVGFSKYKISFEVLKMLDNYDLIFMDMYGTLTNTLVCFWLKYIKKRKFLLSVDGILNIENENIISIFIKRIILKCPYKVLSPGDNVDKRLNKYGVESGRILRYHFTSILKNEILGDVVPYENKKQLKKELGITEERVLISVGRFIKIKGFDIIAEAAKKLPKDIGVYIVGGKPTESFTKHCKDNKLDNIHIINFQKKESLFRYFQASDVFALATRWDPWGLVVNEAMANGLPVITTDMCVAGNEMIEDGVNGYSIKTDDSDSLAMRCLEIMGDDTLRETMGRNNLNLSEEYTVEGMVETHIKIFDDFFNGEL